MQIYHKPTHSWLMAKSEPIKCLICKTYNERNNMKNILLVPNQLHVYMNLRSKKQSLIILKTNGFKIIYK